MRNIHHEMVAQYTTGKTTSRKKKLN